MSPARRSKQAASTDTEAPSPRRSTRFSTKRKSDDTEGTRALAEPQPAKKQKLPVRAKGLPEVKNLGSGAPSFKQNPNNVTEEVREQEEEEPTEEEIPKPQRKQASVRDAAGDSNGDFNDEPIGGTQGDVAAEKSSYESASEEPTEEKTTASEQPASQKSGITSTPPKGKKIVFDDNYDFKAAAEAARLASTATVRAKVQDAGSADGDDDDEAPEDESATKAPSRADKAQLVVLEAVARQAAVQKQKRKERDALFKKQAEERKKTTQSTAQESGPASKNEIVQEVSDMDIDTEPAAAGALRQGRQRFDKTNIPSLLPAEFLESDSEEEEDGNMMDLDEPAAKKPRKIKFDDFSERASRDERVGSTLYRVASKGMDKRLAPKADKASQIKRRDLMMRRKKAVKKRSGFLRNRK